MAANPNQEMAAAGVGLQFDFFARNIDEPPGHGLLKNIPQNSGTLNNGPLIFGPLNNEPLDYGPGPSGANSIVFHQNRKRRYYLRHPGNTGCGFCYTNGEAPNIYTAHPLRNRNGILACPILRQYICPICQASGDKAHTITYCPRIKALYNGRSPPSLAIALKASKFKSNGKPKY